MRRSTDGRPQLAELFLHREGSLVIVVSGDRHCGHSSAVDREGRLQVHYEVDLTCAPTLDHRGFLADQTTIHEAIIADSKLGASMTESCEELAIRWGEVVLAAVRGENPHIEIKELVLKVSSFPHKGWMTATFRPRTP